MDNLCFRTTEIRIYSLTLNTSIKTLFQNARATRAARGAEPDPSAVSSSPFCPPNSKSHQQGPVDPCASMLVTSGVFHVKYPTM